jgi:hypothetical protein
MGTFENSLKRELGKNTAKWLSNKIFGDGHSTPYKIITKNESTKKEKEILRKNREKELESIRRKNIREKLRFQEEKLKFQEEEREIKEEIKKNKREEIERLERERIEIIENNKKQVLEFEEYLNTIQSFHTRSSDEFNWNSHTKKPDFLSLLNGCVNKIKFFSSCENLKQLKERHYPTYYALTNGGNNVINCQSSFALRLEINCDKILIRSKYYDFMIFTAFLNDKGLSEIFENEFGNIIERVDYRLVEINDIILELSNKIQRIQEQIEEYENEVQQINWVNNIFENKKSKINEIIKDLNTEFTNLTKEKDKIYNSTEFNNLNKIRNEFYDYLETIQTIDTIWNECLTTFKEQKELYYLSVNIIENNNNQFFEIAEKIFEPFSFSSELNIKLTSDYNKEIHTIDVYVEGKNIIPEEETYLVRDRELKTRPFSKKRFWEIYQDYVSSITLRVAKEYFSFFTMRNDVIIKSYSEILDESTGNEDTGLILASKFDRNELYKINLQNVDPSSCISRFPLIVDYSPLNGYRLINDTFTQNNDVSVSSSETTLESDSSINNASSIFDDEFNTELTEDIFLKLMDYVTIEKIHSTSVLQRSLKLKYQTTSEFRDLCIESNLIISKEGTYCINIDDL